MDPDNCPHTSDGKYLVLTGKMNDMLNHSRLYNCVKWAFLGPADELRAPRTFSELASNIVKYPYFTKTPTMMAYSLGMAVDAFHAHDFYNSLNFYIAYCLLRHCREVGDADRFLQSMLMPAYIPGLFTPWGTPCIVRSRDETQQTTMVPFMTLLEEIRPAKLGERFLLDALRRALPHCDCRCLEMADPLSPLFVDWEPPVHPSPGDLEFEYKVHRPYIFDCFVCRREAAPGEQFPICGRCRTYRYCSKACQATHWKKMGHRKHCPEPRASWWGRSLLKFERPETGYQSSQ